MPRTETPITSAEISPVCHVQKKDEFFKRTIDFLNKLNQVGTSVIDASLPSLSCKYYVLIDGAAEAPRYISIWTVNQCILGCHL